MKKILFISLALIACEKEPITTTNGRWCEPLDVNDFSDTWTWETIQYAGQQPQQLNLLGLQYITITPDSMYQMIQADSWTDLGCRVIDNGGSQLLQVNINGNTMTWTGLNDGTVWTLSR